MADRSLCRQLVLSSSVLLGAVVGYGRRAYAACVPVGGGNFQCSGAGGAQSISAANAQVSTLPGFSVTANTSGSALAITGAGNLSYTDANASPLTNTGSGTGLYMRTSTGSPSSLTITSNGNVTTNGFGISAVNNGTGGALSITATGDIAATGTTGRGIFATNAGTNLTVTTGGNVTGRTYGIFALNNGSGLTSITTSGDVTATTGTGIFARTAVSGTDLNVTIGAGTLAGGRYGIFARNDGSGTLTITATGDVTGTTDDGIYARHSAGGPIAITVDAASQVRSNGGNPDDYAIETRGGPATLTVDGTITGGAAGAVNFNPFAATADRLELRPTATITGNVFAGPGTDTFVLGGAGAASFNVAQISTQYQGFEVFEKDGASQWTLTGNNAGIPAWAVNAGLLTVQGAMINTAFTVNGGTLALSGSGSVGSVNIANAAGVFDISATTAGATITTLAGVAGSTVTLGAQTLTLSNASGTFNGTIGGTGGLTLSAGTETLTGVNAYSGPTTVNGGTLRVDGSIAASSALAVNAGGTVSGTGILPATTIGGGGTLAPGNPLGTISVQGNLAFAPASTYLVTISPMAADRTNVTGTATLSGTLHVTPQAGTYANTTYTVLTATGGLIGTFSSFSTDGAFLCACVSYDANNVYVTIQATGLTFAGAGQTPNQIATGAAVERLGAGNAIYDVVVLGSVDQARRAFDLLSGEIHASAVSVMLEDSRHVRDAVVGRLRQSYQPQAGPLAAVNPTGAVLAYAPTADASRSMFVRSAAADRVVATWGQAIGAWGNNHGDGNAAPLARSAAGVVSGVDATFNERWRLGFAGGYTKSWLHVDDRSSSADVDNYHLALYGGGQLGALGVRAGVAHAWHDVASGRNIAFAGGAGCCTALFSDRTRADYLARTAQVFGEVGYGLSAGHAAIEPFANAAYVDVRSDGFTETGGAAAITSGSHGSDAALTTLGLRAAVTGAVGNLDAVTAHGSLGWRHAFGTVTPAMTMAFASGSTPFSVAGIPIARDAALVEGGIDMRISSQGKLGVFYAGQLSSRAHDHSVRVNLIRTF